ACVQLPQVASEAALVQPSAISRQARVNEDVGRHRPARRLPDRGQERPGPAVGSPTLAWIEAANLVIWSCWRTLATLQSLAEPTDEGRDPTGPEIAPPTGARHSDERYPHEVTLNPRQRVPCRGPPRG